MSEKKSFGNRVGRYLLEKQKWLGKTHLDNLGGKNYLEKKLSNLSKILVGKNHQNKLIGKNCLKKLDGKHQISGCHAKDIILKLM